MKHLVLKILAVPSLTTRLLVSLIVLLKLQRFHQGVLVGNSVTSDLWVVFVLR